MNKARKTITVFEHETLRFDKGEKRLSEDQFHALEKYYGDGVPFYTLCYKGVTFNEHVGVIQIGDTLIEVLPKADKGDQSEIKWRNTLIGMLKAVGAFDIKMSSESHLQIRPNTILDLYFEMFIKEVEYLLHGGLYKQYRKTEGNKTSLKGNLNFSKNIQHNVTHQERFYVNYTTYDVVHKFHCILYKTIELLQNINTNSKFTSRIGSLLLYFPEMPDIKVSESTFDKLVFNRKNQSYKKAIEIAKLLLLQYHPDMIRGKNHVLALMFDMNALWEVFVFKSLYKNISDNYFITPQTSKFFWKPQSGYRSPIRPDILIETKGLTLVLDTKWKNLNGFNPSPEDLKQMYVYHDYYHADKVALVYPGSSFMKSSGRYLDPKSGKETQKECSVVSIAVDPVISEWQTSIYNHCASWFGLT